MRPFPPKLARRPQIVVGNKADLLSGPEAQKASDALRGKAAELGFDYLTMPRPPPVRGWTGCCRPSGAGCRSCPPF